MKESRLGYETTGKGHAGYIKPPNLLEIKSTCCSISGGPFINSSCGLASVVLLFCYDVMIGTMVALSLRVRCEFVSLNRSRNFGVCKISV